VLRGRRSPERRNTPLSMRAWNRRLGLPVSPH
jgi:hypothetical protein